MPSLQRHVFVCVNEREPGNPKGCCKARGGAEVRDALKKSLAAKGLAKSVRANNAGCLDQCEAGVVVVVYPEQVWYGGVTVDDIDEIVEQHIIGGRCVERLLLPNQPQVPDGGDVGALVTRIADEPLVADVKNAVENPDA